MGHQGLRKEQPAGDAGCHCGDLRSSCPERLHRLLHRPLEPAGRPGRPGSRPGTAAGCDDASCVPGAAVPGVRPAHHHRLVGEPALSNFHARRLLKPILKSNDSCHRIRGNFHKCQYQDRILCTKVSVGFHPDIIFCEKSYNTNFLSSPEEKLDRKRTGRRIVKYFKKKVVD